MKLLLLLILSTFSYSSEYIIDQKSGCKIFNSNPQPKETVEYDGECKDGYITGKGTTQWYRDGKPGQRSVGEYLNGKLHGYAIVNYNSGDKYEGTWANDKFHGKGAYILVNGTKYDGAFINGDQHGLGTLTWANGNYMKCIWKNNECDELIDTNSTMERYGHRFLKLGLVSQSVIILGFLLFFLRIKSYF
ncbi:hypothetical protein MJH12_13435 [bacterium]|nr:hypothetical protein [bacterium]